MKPVTNKVNQSGEAAFVGESALFNGVLGVTTSDGHSGLAGVSDTGVGNGVYGRSKNANGIVGYSSASNGAGSGVAGVNEEGSGNGVYGRSKRSNGVYGESVELDGVLGVSQATGHSGVAGVNDKGNGYGVYAHSANNIGLFAKGGKLAGQFDGDVQVTGNINCGNINCVSPGGSGKAIFRGDVEVTGDIRLLNADCAEDFDIADVNMVEPGTVMVLGDDERLHSSAQEYDKRVAGVVSGAGHYKPGIVLDKQETSFDRKPIALLGKVYCKVDAELSPIEVGDLLTTSSTHGHAMKAADHSKALGAIIGKALRPFRQGKGLIPILIALQ